MLLVVIGTRPEVIKTAPVIRQLQLNRIPFTLVWSGQHYDYEMSKIFFEELSLPEPDIYLENVKSSADIISKLSQMIVELKGIVEKVKPEAIYGLGDTSTTLSAALVAAYERIPFIHDESGMRSFDLSMIEEVNRLIADRIAALHLSPTKLAVLNLLSEGIQPCSIKLVGSSLVDVLNNVMESSLINVGRVRLKKMINVNENEHIITLTVHRRENLTCKKLEILSKIIRNINKLKDFDIKIVFPIHPHTKKVLEECGLYDKLRRLKGIIFTQPLGYLEFIALLKDSKIVITDSGGVQEEAFILGKHTITLRNSTEWPETVLLGYNTLVSLEEGAEKLIPDLVKKKLYQELPVPTLEKSPIGDGRSAIRIAKIIKKFLEEKDHKTCLSKTPYYIPLPFTLDRSMEHNMIPLSTNDFLTLLAQDKTNIYIKRVQYNISDLKENVKIQVEIDWRSIDDTL
ncbi:MAG: UDP-N-acetylglucosamine 2-epimerase (non-hydrolyzing) [Thermofilaceae archaeon]